ncbi:MAG TPA: hypothetical protein VHE33_02875, partial [Acidobacteriaceae bacterium]|nr:hypothetical protein [Acidobacteriaceae bacterium]
YGGFDWPGVAVLGFFVLPLVLVVYESMFDLRRPWGTAAAVYVLIGLTEGTLGHLLFEVAIKTPLYLLALSWVTNQIVLAIPSTGDRVVTSRLMNRASTLVPDEE